MDHRTSSLSIRSLKLDRDLVFEDQFLDEVLEVVQEEIVIVLQDVPDSHVQGLRVLRELGVLLHGREGILARGRVLCQISEKLICVNLLTRRVQAYIIHKTF